jgi:hypothetical protein
LKVLNVVWQTLVSEGLALVKDQRQERNKPIIEERGLAIQRENTGKVLNKAMEVSR